MNPEELLNLAEKRGIQLWVEGEQLRFRAPPQSLDPDLRARLSGEKLELINRLRHVGASKVDEFPLSYSQRSLWFLHQQAQGSSAYHVAISVRVHSVVVESALRQAFQAIVDRHAILRTTYVLNEDVYQRVTGHSEVLLDIIDVRELSDAELRSRVEADYHRPFDLENGPVVRMSLYSRANDDHVLLLVVHHIAADAWSMLLVFQELLKLYAEASGGPAASLPRVTAKFTEYVRWQREMLEGVEGDRLCSYWCTKLAAPRALLNLSDSKARPDSKSFGGASVAIAFGPELTTRLKDFSKAKGTTLFVVLLAGFQVLLSRLANVDDLIVGTPTFSRNRPEFLTVVGDFVNTVALRGVIRPNMSFGDVVTQLRQVVIEALDAQEYPLSLLVSKLQLERDPSRSPLFDAFFTLQRFDQFRDLESLFAADESIEFEMDGLRLAPYQLHQQEGQFDLSLQMIERNGIITGVFKYCIDLLDRDNVQNIAQQYSRIVESLILEPEVAIGQALPYSEKEDIRVLLDRLRDRDVRLILDGDKLSLSAPKGVLDETTRSELGARKEEIKRHLRSLKNNSGALANESIKAISRDNDLPLSHTQQRLWFIRQLHPGSHAYNIPGAVRLRGSLNVDALRSTLNDLIKRHESLRTRFISVDGVPRCRVEREASFDLQEIDLTHLAAGQRETFAMEAAKRLSQQSFDLSRAPLLHTLLIKIGSEEHIFVFVFDHIVTDGLSVGIFWADFRSLYTMHVVEGAQTLPQLTLQYVDYAQWERRRFESGALDHHIAFWKEQLKGAPSLLQLPTDRPRPAVQTSNGARRLLQTSCELSDKLKVLAREENATFFMVLMAAFQVLLYRHSGETDLVVGTVISNRIRPEVEQVCGFFANNIMLRGDLTGNPTGREFIGRIRDVALNAYAHQEMPFDALVDALALQRGLDHSAVFQVMLVLQNPVSRHFDMAGLVCDGIDLPLNSARLDIAVDVVDRPEGLQIWFEYNTDLFDTVTIERMQDHFHNLLADLADRPEVRIDDLLMLSSDERHHVTVDLNRTIIPYPREQTIHGLFEAQVSRSPTATAVVFGGAATSYEELNRRADQLASHLVSLGVRSGSLIGVCMERSTGMIVALLSILKAGAAYVPLDPAFPKDRLEFMMLDAGVDIVITEKMFAAGLLGNRPGRTYLDVDGAGTSCRNGEGRIAPAKPSDLAYVIYTSGSTGVPKGVMLEHASVVNFLFSMQREPGLTASDRLVAVTTLSFDIAGLEIFGPLSVGGTVVIASRATALDGRGLAELLDESDATILQATPTTWRLLVDSGWRGRPELKMISGGESLPRDLAEKLLRLGRELWNLYGPTETTIWSTAGKVTDAARTVPIGRPIANTQVYVLEKSGQPAPIGVVGELCIAGNGLARGYLNRPELTAERFVTVELPLVGSTRLYRTGDVARFLADGRLEFVGRRDNQIKLRGFRIELGEIETLLAALPSIRESTVLVREDKPGDQRLVAYVVPSGGSQFNPDEARTSLRARLPEYMIPNLFVLLKSMPLTPNGKIDRKALPPPPTGSATTSSNAQVVLTAVQRRVVHLWQSILGLDQVGLHENFFDLGGHSLLLVRLQSSLRSEFGIELPLVELFQRTTVAAQAARMSAEGGEDAALRRAEMKVRKRLHG